VTASGGSGGGTGTAAQGGSGGATAKGGSEGGKGGSGGGTGKGGSSGGAGTGGKGGSGGATNESGGGAGGTSAGGSGGNSGTTPACVCQSGCVLPSCLKNFGADCAPSGTCTAQSDPDTGDKNFCYGNGVKKITVLDITDYSTALTVTKSGTTCFTTAYVGNDFFNSAGDLTVKDASGTTVATLSMDLDTSTHYIVTCPGADPVTVDDSCQTTWPLSGFTERSDGTCTDGTCAP
jgi:hypothetical protein